MKSCNLNDMGGDNTGLTCSDEAKKKCMDFLSDEGGVIYAKHGTYKYSEEIPHPDNVQIVITS